MSSIQEVVSKQREFFRKGETKTVSFRKTALKQLRNVLLEYEEEISAAIYEDFKKPPVESQISEFIIVKMELDHMISKLEGWSRPKKVAPSLLNFPSSDSIHYEPYGNSLIIAPWNYPVHLALLPLIGAVAAGNTVVLKPSELTPNTSKLLATIIEKSFTPAHVSVIEGGVETSQELLDQKWDYIFFTGSVKVGKIVYKAAAEHLTPVTLELGGKNPCIIDETAPVALTAKRIVWGKFLNAGQTCIAPDYILIHPKIKNEFLDSMRREITAAYGEDPQKSPDFARIVNKDHFNRLKELLEGEKLAIGGTTDAESLYIAPTVIDEPDYKESKVMEDEIFGPVLPVLTYNSRKEIDSIISNYAKPLAFYLFSKNEDFIKEVLENHSFGGGAVNDTIIQVVNNRLPFGGVGSSGIGSYHGYKSFMTFSHSKPVVHRGTWWDPPFRYAPYAGKLKWLKKIGKWL